MDKIEMLATTLAARNLPIYCAGKQVGKKFMPRTPFGDGYNAARFELSEKSDHYDTYLRALDPELAPAILAMLEAEVLHIETYAKRQATSFYVLMNDTFDYACADGETVLLEDVPTVYDVWQKFGEDGLTAWAAKRRDREPLKAWVNEKYLAAKAYLENGVEPNPQVS